MKPSARTRLAISIAAVALLAAACGSDDSSDDTEAPAATAAVTTAASADTTAAEAATSTTDDAGDIYGEPSTTEAPATSAVAGEGVSIEVGETSLGQVLTSDGLTLYIFTPDQGGTPTCVDACTGAWPPLLGSDGVAGDGVDAAELTAVDRPDGTQQLAYHGWPLYFYAADRAAGDVTGQGVGGNWYVIGADGEPIES